MSVLDEMVDQLAMVNSVHWHSHLLRMEDVHVLRRTLDIDVNGQMKKRSL